MNAIKKTDKSAKPTEKDKFTAALLSRMWDEYRHKNPGPDGKPPKQAVLIEGTGLSQSAVSQYLNGRLKFGYGAVLRFAKFFGVPPTEIRDDLEALPGTEDRDSDWADVTGYSQAAGLGAGAEAEEYAETHSLKFKASSLRRQGLQARSLAIYYGKGDSMEPTIKDGDAIMFDTSDTRVVDGSLYLVQLHGAANAEYYVKRALVLDGVTYFESDNPNGDHNWKKPKRMDSPKTPITVIGRVRWIAGWTN